MTYFWVFIGGGLGSLARWQLSKWLNFRSFSFPLATFASNTISSLLLGLIMGYLFTRTTDSQQTIRLLFAVGFCGGFSTFSTFSYETFMLLNSGDYKTALLSTVLNIATCLTSVALGIWAAKL